MLLCCVNKSNQCWSSYVAPFMRLCLRYKCTTNIMRWKRERLKGTIALFIKEAKWSLQRAQYLTHRRFNHFSAIIYFTCTSLQDKYKLPFLLALGLVKLGCHLVWSWVSCHTCVTAVTCCNCCKCTGDIYVCTSTFQPSLLCLIHLHLSVICRCFTSCMCIDSVWVLTVYMYW